MLPDTTLVNLESPDGHDGFLLKFDALGSLMVKRLKEQRSWLYDGPAQDTDVVRASVAVRDIVFGEAESEW